ncbi:MAG: homoserine O-acetyltransferase/O-succinyltransferase family protein [Acidimicrobiales bacterium]
MASPGGGRRAAEGDELANGRGRDRDGSTIEIAFVNNMPDSAFEETERQFIGLLENAARDIGDITVRFSRYSLPGLSRGAAIEQRLARDYSPVDRVYGDRPDGLIVTGTEPLTDDLRTEAYWEPLTELIGWAEGSTASALLSCLAAHAAALLFDGIERHTLAVKCSGVFVQAIRTDHPLTEGLGGLVHMPHSRLNDLPSALLQADGYANLIESPEMTWTVAVKDRGSCTFVLVQGHPEYSTTSLLREYRRDLQRFLRGERSAVPAIPVGYVDAESHRILESFEARVLANPSDPELIKDFPFAPVEQRLVNTWQHSGTRLYANWLRLIQRRRQCGA